MKESKRRNLLAYFLFLPLGPDDSKMVSFGVSCYLATCE